MGRRKLRNSQRSVLLARLPVLSDAQAAQTTASATCKAGAILCSVLTPVA